MADIVNNFTTGEVLLSASDVRKHFGGVQALKGVSLEVRAGEVHAIVGENGAGKSTLIKVLTGAHAPDGGTLVVGGKPVDQFSPAIARRLGIAAVYQQPALFGDLTVEENLALRLEHGGLWRVLRWGERRRRARELLDRVGAGDISTTTRVSGLGMAGQQLVEIAAAVGSDARIIIFDEPTASLGSRDAERLFEVIRDLKRQGVGMIYISHRLEELPLIADRVTVLRDGNGIGTRDIGTIDRAELIRLMVGRSVETIYPKMDVPLGDVLFEALNITCRAAGVHACSLSVRRGEILGLGGLVGAGRTELARVLFGLMPADSGEVRISGRRVNLRSPREAVAAGIAYVPEDRRKHGVVLDMSVAENTTLSVLPSISQAGLLSAARERTLASEYVQKLGTKAASLETRVGDLSGGNQQKVALSRWLATKPSVLILDEPTQGVDVGAKAEIHRVVGELAANGLAIILISSEMPELLAMSDRIAVMAGGRIQGVLDRADASPERLLELALSSSTAHATHAGAA